MTISSIFSFNGPNGANPAGELVLGPDGTLYGTTTGGGTNGFGTAFRVSTNGLVGSLFSFSNTNGNAPYGRLTWGLDGLLYGTTSRGGANDDGTVFKLTTNGTFTSLMSFSGTNGAQPRAGLVLGADGNLYGTTAFGGTNGLGTTFRFSTNSTLAPLASFGSDGNTPYAGLLQGINGFLYGTAFLGGTNDNGTVFQLQTNGALAHLYSFHGTGDGGNPYARLIQGADGNLYGTTFYDGAYGLGTVFRLTPGGTFSNLFSFAGTNGAYPQASLLQGADGNFYGTTQNGGAFTNQFGNGYGTLFQLTPGGVLTTLVSFAGTNGAFPRAGLVQGLDGSLYGTTTYGGTNDNGTVFRLTVTAPPPPPMFQSIAQTGDTLSLTWTASVGHIYQLLSKTDWDQANWTPVGESLTATNTIMTTLVPLPAGPQAFYRLLLLH